MNSTNPMLAVTIYEAHAQASSLSQAVLNAAVHAWFEGHIAGEGDKKTTKAGTKEDMPAPPFPSRDSRLLADIIKETSGLFTSEELTPAAVCYVAGIAWAAGYSEGKTCPGCSYRGTHPEKAAAVRAGESPTVLMNGVATDRVPPSPRPEGDAKFRARFEPLATRLAAARVSYQGSLRRVDY